MMTMIFKIKQKILFESIDPNIRCIQEKQYVLVGFHIIRFLILKHVL